MDEIEAMIAEELGVRWDQWNFYAPEQRDAIIARRVRELVRDYGIRVLKPEVDDE